MLPRSLLESFLWYCICLINLILEPRILISDDPTAISKLTCRLTDIPNLSFPEVYATRWGQMCRSSSLRKCRATFLIANDDIKLDYQGIIEDARPSLYNCQGQKGQEVQNIRCFWTIGAAIAVYCSSSGTPGRKAAGREQGRERTLYSIHLADNPEQRRGKQIHKVRSMGWVILQQQKEKILKKDVKNYS